MRFEVAKNKKCHRLNHRNIEIFQYDESFNVALITITASVLTFKHIDNMIKVIKFCGRKKSIKYKIWIPITPYEVVTNKPKGLRMGRGKGVISHKVIKAPAGTVILRISPSYKKALLLCAAKLPSLCKIEYFEAW